MWVTTIIKKLFNLMIILDSCRDFLALDSCMWLDLGSNTFFSPKVACFPRLVSCLRLIHILSNIFIWSILRICPHELSRIERLRAFSYLTTRIWFPRLLFWLASSHFGRLFLYFSFVRTFDIIIRYLSLPHQWTSCHSAWVPFRLISVFPSTAGFQLETALILPMST